MRYICSTPGIAFICMSVADNSSAVYVEMASPDDRYALLHFMKRGIIRMRLNQHVSPHNDVMLTERSIIRTQRRDHDKKAK